MPEPQYIHLLVVEDDKGRREFYLDAPGYSIGRDVKCDIRLISQFVSRRHATLVKIASDDDTDYYRIVDGVPTGKRSANGLLINGHKLQAHDLCHEDEIVFGPKVRAFYYRSKPNGGDGSYPFMRNPPNPTSPGTAANFLEKCLSDSAT